MKKWASVLRAFGWIWLQLWAVLMLVQIYDKWSEYPPILEQLQSPFILNWLVAIGGFAVGVMALIAARKLNTRFFREDSNNEDRMPSGT